MEYYSGFLGSRYRNYILHPSSRIRHMVHSTYRIRYSATVFPLNIQTSLTCFHSSLSPRLPHSHFYNLSGSSSCRLPYQLYHKVVGFHISQTRTENSGNSTLHELFEQTLTFTSKTLFSAPKLPHTLKPHLH